MNISDHERGLNKRKLTFFRNARWAESRPAWRQRLWQENEDKTKQYEITGENDVNLNKAIFGEFAKENITIVEMKKAEATLEDAFMKIIKEGGDK